MLHEMADVYIGFRLPRWLREDIIACAKKSGWSPSQQIRYELMAVRGKVPQPYMPIPDLPLHDQPTHRRRRLAKVR